MFDILKAIFFGIIQGITEFLPISSTGHLILFEKLVPLSPSEGFFDMFSVVIQFGSIMAVLVLFWHTLNPFSAKKSAAEKKATVDLWGKIMVAVIPAALAGLLLDDIIDAHLRGWVTVAVTLIVYGALFIIVENRNKAKAPGGTEDAITYRTALYIGAFQMLALVPGTSRSGATILGAMLLGLSRTTAAHFSFFMAIPTMLGASGLKMVKFAAGGGGFGAVEAAALAAGTLTAFAVSIVAIKFLLGYVRSHSFKVFGWYRIALGAAVVLFFAIGGR